MCRAIVAAESVTAKGTRTRPLEKAIELGLLYGKSKKLAGTLVMA